MEALPARHLKYSVLCLLFRFIVSVSSSIRSFSPVDNYLINCGSDTGITIDIDRRNFIGDSSGFGSGFRYSSKNSSLTYQKASDNPLTIYDTVRVFNKPSRYVFNIKKKGTHMLRLHFNQFNSPDYDLRSSLFHVLANGVLLLKNFTSENPRIKEYLIWVEEEELVISFVPIEKSTAFVNAIEVISAPDDLVPDIAHMVKDGTVRKIHGLKKESLETVYRVNVGGPKVTPFNDSMWRTWVPDDTFLSDGVDSRRVYFGGRIMYRKGGPSREICPDNVYNSARVTGGRISVNRNQNITWVFPITPGYKYLVRMHFCDIASIALGLLRFNVYVNEYLAYENMDLSYITNGLLASPFYADFVVDGGGLNVLSLSVGSSERSLQGDVDAILNGVEITKMNNSMGNFDGAIPGYLVLKSSSGNCFGVPILLFSSAFLLLAAVVIVQRGMRMLVMPGVGWSWLQADFREGYAKVGG